MPIPTNPKSIQKPNEHEIEILTRLSIAQQTMSLYPQGHPSTNQSINNALKILQQQLAGKGKLLICQFNNTLVINDVTIDKELTASRDIISVFYRHDISAVQFKQGLHQKELNDFLCFIIDNPKGRKPDCSFSYIDIFKTNYDQFQINPYSKPKTIEKQGSDALISSISEDCFHSSPTTETKPKPMSSSSIWGLTQYETVSDQGLAEPDMDIETYESILLSYSKDEESPTTSPNSEALHSEDINKFLNYMSPELKNQLLSLIPKHEKYNNNEVLNVFYHDLVIKMLYKTNKSSKELSPSLVKILKRIIQTTAPEKSKKENKKKNLNNKVSSFETDHKSVENLSHRENFENYVEEHYKDTLERLSQYSYKEELEPSNNFNPDHYKHLFSKQQLDTSLNTILLGLIKTTQNPNEYKDFSNTISGLLKNSAINDKNILLILKCIGIFKRHIKSHQNKNIQAYAKVGLNSFLDMNWLNNLIIQYENKQDANQKRFAALFVCLGIPALEALLKRVNNKKSIKKDEPLVKLICAFKTKAVKILSEWLLSADSMFIKNMAIILGQIQGSESEELLLKLSSKANIQVRASAITCLFAINQKKAEELLIQDLYSKEHSICCMAITLSGRLKAKAMVAHLLSMNKKSYSSKKNMEKKLLLIQALGQIGDLQAIPHLIHIIKKRLSLFPSRLFELKVEACTALDTFKRPNTKTHVDELSDNQIYKIRQICRGIQRRTSS